MDPRAARELREAAGALAGLLYLTAPYTLSNIFRRGDLAELGAMMLFPVVLHHALALIERPRWRHGLALALAYGLLITMHAFSALLFTIPFVLLHGVLLIRGHASLKRLLLPAAGCAFGVALAGFYWIPVFAEMDTVSIHGFFTMEQFETFALPAQGLLGDRIEGPMGGRLFTYGWVLPLAGLVGFGLRRRPGTPRASWLGVFLGTAIAAGFLSTKASGFLYESIPLLAKIVFPWRWLGVGSLCLALLGSRVVLLAPRPAALSAVFALIAVVHAPGVTIPDPTWHPPGTFDYRARAEREVVLFDYGEYYPATAQHVTRPAGPPRATAGCRLGQLERRPPGAAPGMRVPVEAERECVLTFPHLQWIAFEGRIDGNPAPLAPDPRGLATMRIPPGTHVASLIWRPTTAQRAGAATTSVASGLWLLLVIWRAFGPRWRRRRFRRAPIRDTGPGR